MSREEERMQINLEMVGDLMRALKVDEITVTYCGDWSLSYTVSCTNTDLNLKEIKAQIYTESGLKTDSLYKIATDLTCDAIGQTSYKGFKHLDGGGGTFTIYSNNTSTLEHYYNNKFMPYKIEYKLDESDEVIKKLFDITKKILARWGSSALNIEFTNHSRKLTFYGDWNGYYRYPTVKEQELEWEKLEFKELASITSRHFDMVIKNLDFDPEHILIWINPNKNKLHVKSFGYTQIKKIIMEPVKFGKQFEIESSGINKSQ